MSVTGLEVSLLLFLHAAGNSNCQKDLVQLMTRHGLLSAIKDYNDLFSGKTHSSTSKASAALLMCHVIHAGIIMLQPERNKEGRGGDKFWSLGPFRLSP